MDAMFDTPVDRRNTNCARWDTMDKIYGGTNLIHLGVSDMDFKTPPAITAAFQKCLDHGIYGYTDLSENFYAAILRWQRDKNGVDARKEEIVFCPRISISASLAVEVYTRPGDEVLLHTPSYDALHEAIVKNGRVARTSPLKDVGGRYEIDFDALERLVTPQTKMYILCSPFNPVCRVWTPAELEKIGAFCVRHDLILFVDEIHGDIVAPGVRFTSALTLPGAVRERLVVASSLTKTFNIPGVIVSYLLIPNPDLRAKMEADIDRLGMHNPNVFAVPAVEEGYTHCDDWYAGMLRYVDENERWTRDYFAKNFPGFTIYPREGTFLLWISYAKEGCTGEALSDWFLHEAGVEVYMGTKFGPDGKGFFRLNIASPRCLLAQAYAQMVAAYPKLHQM